MLLGKRHGPCTLGEIVTKMRLEALRKHSQPQTMTRLREGGGGGRERGEFYLEINSQGVTAASGRQRGWEDFAKHTH